MNSGLSNSVLSLGPWRLGLTYPFWNQNRPLGFRNFFFHVRLELVTHETSASMVSLEVWLQVLCGHRACGQVTVVKWHLIYILSSPPPPRVLRIISALFITTNVKHMAEKWLSHLLSREWWQEKLSTCLVCPPPPQCFQVEVGEVRGHKIPPGVGRQL